VNGFNLSGFYHLISHAVFKSLLFLCTGIIIHLIKSNQDARYHRNLKIVPFDDILSIMGCSFLSGFCSKDLIIEFSEIRMFLIAVILVSLLLKRGKEERSGNRSWLIFHVIFG